MARPQIGRRALVIGVVLSVLCGLMIPYLDHYIQGTFVGGQHLPPGAVFALIVLLLLINPVLRRISPKLALTRPELLLIYAMLLVSTLVPGHGSENLFIPVSVSALYYDTPARGWDRIFLDYVPKWFHPQSPDAITSFYESLPPGAAIPWGQWAVPLLAWATLVLALYGLATFLSALLYPQWSDREKLTFPLVALPLEMTANSEGPFAAKGFWANPVMWVGFAIAALIGAGKGLGYFYPQFAGFRLEYPSLHTYFPDEPWRSIGWSPVIIYPLVIAVSVLLRSDVSGSLAFFYWFTKFQRVGASALGLRDSTFKIEGYPVWLGAQPWGGYFAYLGMGLWGAREHLANAWRQATGRAPASPGLPFSYRITFAGVAICMVVATVWLTAAGMLWWTALATTVCYAMIITILSKVVAESGLLYVQQTLMPGQVLNNIFGTKTIGTSSFTIGMYFEQAFGTDLRATVMPSLVQGLRIADESGISKRRMMLAFWLAIAAALPVTYFRSLQVCYRHGAVNLDPWYSTWSGLAGWNALTRWLANPRPASGWLALAMAGGAAALWGISVMRRRYLWFPLHPVGYIMMQAHSMSAVWFSIFAGWALKVIILRYGGAKGLKKAVPFFLGIAFGDIAMMVFWIIVSAATDTHRVFLLPQ